jgi:hypothetical protein
MGLGAADYHSKAEECHRHAELAIDPQDRADWLRLALKWQKLADTSLRAAAVAVRPSGDKDGDERT